MRGQSIHWDSARLSHYDMYKEERDLGEIQHVLSMAGWHCRVARVRRDCETWGSRVMLEDPSVVLRSSISALRVNIGFKERQELALANGNTSD